MRIMATASRAAMITTKYGLLFDWLEADWALFAVGVSRLAVAEAAGMATVAVELDLTWVSLSVKYFSNGSMLIGGSEGIFALLAPTVYEMSMS